MTHPLVEALLRDPPPDESDVARRARVRSALGELDDPAAVLALWDALLAAKVAVIRQRRDHRGYRGTGRLRGHELSDLTLASELVLAAATTLRFERATVERARSAGHSRRGVDEDARGSQWRTRLLLGGAAASVVAFGALLALDLHAWLPLAFAGASVLPSIELGARVMDKLPKRHGETMRRRREEHWLSPDEVRRWLESRRDETLSESLGEDERAAEPWVSHVRARVSALPPEESEVESEVAEESDVSRESKRSSS